ncbi:tail fiber assembly protein [Pseudomonas asiatica]|uniref:tail fiber assembly protein n=1 Tax=Pseudomonas asiatica TaxID=2219225 RepID=UPI00273A6170|nr:tail fiber assembly protein [Pseudomonas sp. MR 02]
MIIKLSPVRSDALLSVIKAGDALVINGVSFDFSRLKDGDTLPVTAISSEWITQDVMRNGAVIEFTLLMPHAADAPESARFPADIVNPADGVIRLPGLESEPSQPPIMAGVIDWSQVVTEAMKQEHDAAALLAQVAAQATSLRLVADTAIAPLQDAVELEEATEAEAALLKEWKRYRVALSRLPEQEGYPTTINWPTPPA